MDETEFNETSFVNAVNKHNPTVITIAFCYTNVSVINDILRLSGIYSFMILSKDRAAITEDRCMSLDSTQKQLIEDCIKNQPKNIFLWGSSGTGKTIILTEILKMKISNYEKKSVKLNIFITSYMATSESQLMKEFKEKYFAYLPSECEVQFIPFNLLCQGKTKLMLFIQNLTIRFIF